MPAYRAVAAPVEGTILSVARGAALAATATDTDNLADVARAATAGAAEALARTPEQLAALARAGVVDAGGRGLVVLLDALVEVITGEAKAPTPEPARRPVNLVRESGSAEYAFEVQFLLDAHEDAVTELKSTLSGLGDSLAVVGIGLMTRGRHAPDLERACARQRRRRGDGGGGPGGPAAPHLGHPFRDPDRERQELRTGRDHAHQRQGGNHARPTRHRGGRRR